MKRIGIAAFVLFILVLAGVEPASAEKRVALVIGNSAYVHAPELKNARHDAERFAETLGRLNFTVITGVDLDRSRFEETVRKFARALRGADVALLYYAGHGLQVNGLNYLVPTDAKLADVTDLDFETLVLDTVLKQMEREARTNLVFLDACRDNPLARNLTRGPGTRSTSVGRGLARIEQVPPETYIAFATDPGNVAQDGEVEHSPFTKALLKHVETPNLDVVLLLRRVRREVMEETGGRQVPWDNSSLTRDFYFNPVAPGGEARTEQPPRLSAKPTSPPVPNPAGQAAVEQTPRTTVRPTSPPAPDPASQAWDAVSDTASPAILETFIARFPGSIYADFAKARLQELRAEEARQRREREQQQELRAEEARQRREREQQELRAEEARQRREREQQELRAEEARQRREREQRLARLPDPAPSPTVRALDVRPSFPCDKAKLPAEHTVCNSPQLARLDLQVAELYNGLRLAVGSARQRALRESQRLWLARRNACGYDTACINQRYQEQIRFLQAGG